MRRWKKRVRTSALKRRERDQFYGFTNLVEAGHVGSITIDYICEGRVVHHNFFPQVNLTTARAEAFRP